MRNIYRIFEIWSRETIKTLQNIIQTIDTFSIRSMIQLINRKKRLCGSKPKNALYLFPLFNVTLYALRCISAQKTKKKKK